MLIYRWEHRDESIDTSTESRRYRHLNSSGTSTATRVGDVSAESRNSRFATRSPRDGRPIRVLSIG